MNISVLYAARKEFNPKLSKWPQLKTGYPFATFLHNYGWPRPVMVMLSMEDQFTTMEKLIEQIKFDFDISSTDKLMVALEKNDTIVATCKFSEFEGLRESDGYSYDSAVILSPNQDMWYIFANGGRCAELAKR